MKLKSQIVNSYFLLYAVATVLLIALFVVSALPVSAATTGSVAATVTTQNISVTVTDGSVSYGTMDSNTSKSTISTDLNDTQTAANNGNVAEDLNIKGQNSTNWTLAAASGSDQYVHMFCVATCGSPPTNFTALTTSYQALSVNKAPTGTQTFDLQITTPNPSTVYTQQSVDVTVQAVIH